MTLRTTQRLRSSLWVFSAGCSEGPDKSVTVFVNTEAFMTDTAALHWTASGRLFRSIIDKNKGDVEFWGDHVFAHNSPIEHEQLLIVFFGFLQNYFQSLGDSHGPKEVQELWTELWDDWKNLTSIHQKIDNFQLLETSYLASVRGTFMSDATNRNSTSQTRRALVAMASTPGTTSVFPSVACMFLEFAFELCEEGNAPVFRLTMIQAVNHVLK
jgi:hypothetical protein